MIKPKAYQQPTTDERRGLISFEDVRIVQSFGITSFVVVTTVRDFVRMLEAQLEIPKKAPEAPADDEEVDIDQPLAEAVPLLLALLQRGWNKPRKENVEKIEQYARQGISSNAPFDIVHFPEFTVYSPSPVYFEPRGEGSRFGRLTGDLLHILIDGLTRGTGLKRLRKECGDEEIVIRILPGLPLVAAKQIFVDMNTTAVPVPFADIVEKDARRPAYRLAMEVAKLVPGIKARQAYMFVQQALLGPAGEAAGAEPPIKAENYEERRALLVHIVDVFKTAMGAQWGSEASVLASGYGLGAVGRLYFDDPSNFEIMMTTRVAKMNWDRDSPAVQELGFAEKGIAKTKTKLTSYPMIRKFSQLVRGADWIKLAPAGMASPVAGHSAPTAATNIATATALGSHDLPVSDSSRHALARACWSDEYDWGHGCNRGPMKAGEL